jgi:transposase
VPRKYDGGETRVKQFVRGLVSAPTPRPAVRCETEPGQQMQADWASVGRGAEKLRVFIATLGWSRAAYVEFCDDERVETLIHAHENALLAFGAVPIEALYDNMRAKLHGKAFGQNRNLRFSGRIECVARERGADPGNRAYVDYSAVTSCPHTLDDCSGGMD